MIGPSGGNPLAKRPLQGRHRYRCSSDRRLDPDPPLRRGQHQVEPAEDHRQRQPLAHVEVRRLRERDELLVRLTDELDAEAEQAVEEQEGADELARLVPRLGLPEHEGEDAEQDDAFEEGFVQLARMPRRTEDHAERRHFLEADCPRHRRRRAPQLLIDEVGEPPEAQPQRNAAGDVIVDPEPGELLLVREVEDPERGADDSAVERHPAVPQFQHLHRMPQIFAEIVEQDVADAAAEDDPEGGVEYEVVGMAPSHRRAGLLEQLQHVPIADDDPGEVGDAVPAKIERPMCSNTGESPRSGNGGEAGIVDVLQGLPHECSAPHKAGAAKGKGA